MKGVSRARTFVFTPLSDILANSKNAPWKWYVVYRRFGEEQHSKIPHGLWKKGGASIKHKGIMHKLIENCWENKGKNSEGTEHFWKTVEGRGAQGRGREWCTAINIDGKESRARCHLLSCPGKNG